MLKSRLDPGVEYSYFLNTRKCDKYNNAELTIQLNIAFQQVNPVGASGLYPDADDNDAKILSWTPSEWANWKRDFTNTVKSRWDGKYWLRNDTYFNRYKVGKVDYFPNIWCRFDVDLKDAPPVFGSKSSSTSSLLGLDGYVVVKVVKLDPSVNDFRSHSLLYTNSDTQPSFEKDICEDSFSHITANHEVGHLIGLLHVNDGKGDCLSDLDEGFYGIGPTLRPSHAHPSCYTGTVSETRSVMGRGNELRLNHADPWRKCIMNMALHRGWENNTCGQKSWAASMKRLYPRTRHEIRNGIIVNQANLHRYPR